jgi:hypothetical protein
MSIFVSIEDQDGETLSEVLDITRIQRHFKSLENSICARFISETEDAAFNQSQLPDLHRELSSIGEKSLKQEEQTELKKVLTMCEKIRGKRNTYIKFYADSDS